MTDMEKKIVEVIEKSHVMTFKVIKGRKITMPYSHHRSSFYASPNGYHMKIIVYPNSDIVW